MRFIICLILITIAKNITAQNPIEKYAIISEVKGDLNKDNINDKIVVLKDDTNENATYILQLFFGKPNDKYDLFLSSEKAIPPTYLGASESIDFSEINIKDGILTISFEFSRGGGDYKFRFNNDNFELIGVTNNTADCTGHTFSSNFNLLTGIRIIEKGRVDSDSILSTKKEKILIRPLPQLGKFVPFERDLY
jgi:hypothetical protein